MIEKRLKEAAKNSFKRDICKRDMDLAEKALTLFATLPPTYGRTAVINTLLGKSPATKNRPEFNWARENGYGPSQLMALKYNYNDNTWSRRGESFLECIEDLMVSYGYKEAQIITALETFDGDSTAEEKLESDLNDASNGCLSQVIEKRKGAKDAYKQLSPMFAKMRDTLPDEGTPVKIIKKAKKPLSPLSAFKRALTHEYVERTYEFVKDVHSKVGLFHCHQRGLDVVCGMSLVPALWQSTFDSSKAWREELEDWHVRTRTFDGGKKAEYNYSMYIFSGNPLTCKTLNQLTHTVVVEGNSLVSAKCDFIQCQRQSSDIMYLRYSASDFKGVDFIPEFEKDHPRECWMLESAKPSNDDMEKERLSKFKEVKFVPIVGEITTESCKKCLAETAKIVFPAQDPHAASMYDKKNWKRVSKKNSGSHTIREFEDYGNHALIEDDGTTVVSVKFYVKFYEK